MLVLHQEAISANDAIYGINKQGSRHKYKKHRQSLEDQITSKIGVGPYGKNHTRRVALKIQRLWGPKKRMFDEANLIGGLRYLWMH